MYVARFIYSGFLGFGKASSTKGIKEEDNSAFSWSQYLYQNLAAMMRNLIKLFCTLSSVRNVIKGYLICVV